MASAGEFCSWCCMWIAVVGILFNAVLIALVYRDNYYLLAMNHKDKTAEQLGFAMIVYTIYYILYMLKYIYYIDICCYYWDVSCLHFPLFQAKI